MPLPDPSLLLLVGFTLWVAATLGGGIWIAARYGSGAGRGSLGLLLLCIVAWLTASAGVAASGIVARWELRPPPGLLLFLTGFILTIALSRHPAMREVARRAPIALLIGFQAFRLPLELIMHRAYSEGLMPIQMSYSGRNLDIVTGILALALGVLGTQREIPRWAAWGFNGVGLALLANIVGIAVVSTPVFEAFGPDRLNLWIAQVPFVWLPTVFVTLALLGHLLLIDRLRHGDRSSTPLGDAGKLGPCDSES